MSHIFDALQRSEAERFGADLSSTPAATELLERAERQAISKWDAAPAVEPFEPLAPLGQDDPARIEAGLPMRRTLLLRRDPGFRLMRSGEKSFINAKLSISPSLRKTGSHRLSRVTLRRPRLSGS